MYAIIIYNMHNINKYIHINSVHINSVHIYFRTMKYLFEHDFKSMKYLFMLHI